MLIKTLLTMYFLSGNPHEPITTIDGSKSVNFQQVGLENGIQTEFEHIIKFDIGSEEQRFREMTGGLMSSHLGSSKQRVMYKIKVPKEYYFGKIVHELNYLTREEIPIIKERLNDLNLAKIKQNGDYIQAGAILWYITDDR